ncbi:hypothetical protein [Thermoanaerobacter kivui]|nr:hypothetical protein [Thermoanaerobacter kivui]
MNNSFKNDILINVAAEAAKALTAKKVLTRGNRFAKIEELPERQREGP